MTAKIKLNAASGGGSIAINAPSSAGSDTDLLDTSGNLALTGSCKVGTITDTSGSNSSTTQQIYEGRAKIFVCFNGTNVAIRDHFGVTSITDEDTGDFSINFSTAMSNNNYCAVYGSSNWETSNADSYTVTSESNNSNRATNKLNIRCMRLRFDTGGAPTFKDPAFVSVAIFGDQ